MINQNRIQRPNFRTRTSQAAEFFYSDLDLLTCPEANAHIKVRLTTSFATIHRSKMLSVAFCINTAAICYNCCAIKFDWLVRDFVNPRKNENNVLTIVFVLCPICASRTIHQKKRIDVQRYSDTIDYLRGAFKCVPTIFRAKRFFSILEMRFKSVARVQHIKTISLFSTSAKFTIPDDEGIQLFIREPTQPIRIAAPGIDATDAGPSLPFISVANMQGTPITHDFTGPPPYTLSH